MTTHTFSKLLKKAPTRSVEEVEKQIGVLSKVASVDVLKNTKDVYEIFADLLNHLTRGTIRSAEPLPGGTWKVNSWVREGILSVGFRLGTITQFSSRDETLQFSDKDILPLQDISELIKRNVRVVPGGVSIRVGSYIGDSVVIMPPSYINFGAYIGKETMIDSLALIGTCAQIGERVHIAAGAIVGGVLEPANAKPCIVGDNAFIGAYAGIFSGVEIRQGAILAPKAVITEATEVWEALPGKPERRLPNSLLDPVRIPDRALVIPGSMQLLDKNGKPSLLSKNIVIIRGYYPKDGNPKVALNELLRTS